MLLDLKEYRVNWNTEESQESVTQLTDKTMYVHSTLYAVCICQCGIID